MLKRPLTVVLLGLAVASHGVLAQGVGATGDDRKVDQRQQKPDQQKQDERKRIEEYWATHDDDAPGYPFNP